MDALDYRAFNQLAYEGYPLREARSRTSSMAKDMFERKYLHPLQNVTHKPAANIQLRGMLLLVNSTGGSLNHSPLRHAQGRY